MFLWGASEATEEKPQHPQRKQDTEDSENPPTLDTEIIEEEEESIVEELSDHYYSLNSLNNKCCFCWIVLFVLIMIFSRQVVHTFFWCDHISRSSIQHPIQTRLVQKKKRPSGNRLPWPLVSFVPAVSFARPFDPLVSVQREWRDDGVSAIAAVVAWKW